MTALQKVVLEAKLKLKQERRSLIEDWLTVSLTFFLFISGRSVGKPLKTFHYRFVCDRIEASHMISLVSFNLYISHTRHIRSRPSTVCVCSTFLNYRNMLAHSRERQQLHLINQTRFLIKSPFNAMVSINQLQRYQ